jgi:hypothetical protein
MKQVGRQLKKPGVASGRLAFSMLLNARAAPGSHKKGLP